MQDSDYNVQPALLLILVFALIGVFLLLTSGKGRPRPPISQGAMDGFYVNETCPDFEIRNGRLIFEGGAIVGTVGEGKLGPLLATPDALRFEEVPGDCRFVTIKGYGQNMQLQRKAFASPIQMLNVLSSDETGRQRWWTRQALPIDEGEPVGKGTASP